MRVLMACACVILPAAAGFGQVVATGDTAPGVVLRLYELGQYVPAIPELAGEQPPNAVRIVPVLDLGGDGAPFEAPGDQFLTHVDGFITPPKAGTYAFRLISDDGAKLWIGGRLVVDHDGLHGAEPKDGTIELGAGPQPLRIRHFDAGGDDRLALQWKPPGAGEFVLVPSEALSHPADVDRTTAPGVKKIVPPLPAWLPGEGRPVAGAHPGLRITAAEEPDRQSARLLDDGILGVIGTQQGSAQSEPLIWIPPAEGEYVDCSKVESGRYQGQFVVVAAPGAESKRLFLFVPDATDGDRPPFSVAFRLGITPDVDAEAYEVEPAGDGPFEMLAVRALANGLVVEFTRPLDARVGWDPESYYVEQWPFSDGKPPRRDGVRHDIKSASVSPDRTRVFLEIDLKRMHVVYLRLLPPCISEVGERPWSTEAWYTLHVLPRERGELRKPPAEEPQNVLTAEERAAGWKLLFDGQSTDAWRGYGRPDFPSEGWQAVDGCLTRVGPGGDIITKEQFGDFELALEWRIAAAGNSGVFFRVKEELGPAWATGPEMQVLDDLRHPDGRNPATSAGSNYALHAPAVRKADVLGSHADTGVAEGAVNPVGLFNAVRIIARGPHVEYWMNGARVVQYEIGSPDWKKRVGESKFSTLPHFGKLESGHLVLQDHGDKVWYRNLKIRPLEDE